MPQRALRIGWLLVVLGTLLATPVAAEEGPDPYASSSGSWGQEGLDQWALPAIGWSDPGAGGPVLVAVLDSGVDWLHPDLGLDRIWRNPGEVQNGIDDDGNGYVDDRIGWDFVDGRPIPWDDVGHGTHVAGVIAATAGNAEGIAGVSAAARILPLKVLGGIGNGRATHVAAALDYAVVQEARVINLSLGGDGLTRIERDAIARASESAVVVMAVGNRSQATGELGLHDLPGVLLVAALGRDGQRAPFSDFGPEVRVSAPGVDILSLRARATDFLRAPDAAGAAGASFVGAAYQRASGASFAAALVSGAAARLLADRPELTPAQVARLLEQSARDVEPPGVDQRTGYGAIDLAAASAADPAFFVSAGLDRIELAPGGQLYRVVGAADADRFAGAKLTLTPLLPPVSEDEEKDEDAPVPVETTIPIEVPVSRGILLRLDRGALADAPEWQLTLTVDHESGASRRAGLVFAMQSGGGPDATEETRAVPGPAAIDVAAGHQEADDAATPTLWELREPLELPSAVHRIRSIPGLSSATEWARAHDLPDHAVRRSADGSGIASLPEARAAADCGEDPCPIDACRSHRAGLALEGPASGSFLARLVPEAPLLSTALEPAPELAGKAISPGALSCDAVPFELPAPGTSTASAAGFAARAADAAGDPGCWDLVADPACAPARIPAREIAPEYEPGRIVALVPRKAAKAGAALATLAGLRFLDAKRLPSIDRVLLRFETAEGGAAAEAALALLTADGRVELAQRERRYRTVGAYSDPLAALSYGPAQIGAEQLHATATGVGVRIAVIDSGVDAEHPELAGRVVGSHDTTGYGPSPDRHGTAVAGLIAAQPDNGAGAWGAAPGAEILAIKSCQPARPSELGARCWSSTIARGLDIALENDAHVINLSLAGPQDPLVERLVGAAEEKGVLVVAASGNGGPNARPSYPAALDSVVAVTAVDSEARLYRRATRGAFVDVAAPGVEVVSPAPGGEYPVLSGTSFATAFVSGAAALLLELQRDAGAAGVRSALEGTSEDLGAPGQDPLFGNGRVDLCAAAALLRQGEAVCP